VDHQAHGVVHNIPAGPGSTDEYLLGELQGSVDAFLEHFGKRPIAYIWPGGGFTPRSVELARGAGYRLGFTVNPRGPVMFNWVPQAAARDDMRPSYIPEGPAADPLLTLPRYWDTDALIHLDAVAQIGDQAAAYAAQNKATELAYYDIACAETYGPLPAE
jgi:peptidoglycan/xylan/chitin deacetylase (PgdA/CDA1 family)